MKKRGFQTVLLIALLVPASGPATAGPDVAVDPGVAPIVGQVVSAEAWLDGVAVPSGTTMLSPAEVRTGANPAILHLADGSVMALLPESAAELVVTASGRLELTVAAGTVAYADEGGQVVELGVPARAVWAFRRAAVDDQIGEGASTAEDEERLCELVDWTPAKYQLCTVTDPDHSSCAWELLVVPASEAPELVGTRAVYAGTDRNDLGLDENCKEEVAGLPLPAKIGIGIGAAALGAYVIDEIDDEEGPASPVTP